MLSEQSVKAFIETLGSATPTPGGGSAAALSGALCAALLRMVAGLTENKKGYEDVSAEMAEIGQRAKALSLRLTELIDLDTVAYDKVMRAYKLPKASEAEKAERSRMIQAGLVAAADTPLAVMRASAEAAAMLKTVAVRGNKNARTDAGVGALLMLAAAEGAFYNVAVNLDSITDDAYVKAAREEAENLLGTCRAAAKAVRGALG